MCHERETKYWEDNVAVETLGAMVTPGNQYDVDNSQRFCNAMLQATWWIEKIDHGGLLTSDHPLIGMPIRTQNTRPISEYSLGGLLLSGGYVLLFPLSPNTCFYAYIGGHVALDKAQHIVSQNKAIVDRLKAWYTPAIITKKRSLKSILEKDFNPQNNPNFISIY